MATTIQRATEAAEGRASGRRIGGLDRAKFLEATATVVVGAALLISAAAAYLCLRGLPGHGVGLAIAVFLFNTTTAVCVASSLRTRAGLIRVTPDQGPDQGAIREK